MHNFDLSLHIKEIRSHQPLQRNSIIYGEKRWIDAFDDALHLKEIADFDGQNISRETIINLYVRYYAGEIENPLTPFLLTMVWGYDSSGFGPFRVNRFMNELNQKLIGEALTAMAKEDVKTAFELLMKIHGLNISFVSKILYFAARANGIKIYPLIFDIQVARKLVSLTSGGVLDDIVEVAPTKRYKNYQAYNNLIHKWAAELKVEAENVEYFIFKYEKSEVSGRRNKF